MRRLPDNNVEADILALRRAVVAILRHIEGNEQAIRDLVRQLKDDDDMVMLNIGEPTDPLVEPAHDPKGKLSGLSRTRALLRAIFDEAGLTWSLSPTLPKETAAPLGIWARRV